MVECPIPQDVLKYKPKMVASFSTRQIVWFAIGAVIGMFFYFSVLKDANKDARLYLTMFSILPALCIGFVKIYDQPFEKIVPVLVTENILWPAKRYKKIQHPAWDKYKKTREWDVDMAEILKESEDTEAQTPKDAKKKGKGAKSAPGKKKNAKNNKKFKAAPSKQWVALR